MSNPYLPPEILDYIVDFLHDDPDALERCCLTSKSWIPRTRKHLFAEVDLWHEDRLGSWKKMFSDPSTSPAHFVRSLRIGGACAVTTADAEVGGWLRGFAHIVHLGVETSEFYHGGFPVSLVPFHGFSRTIKSLRVKSVDLPPSEIFDFILSSPLLEDLAVAGWRTWACDMDGSDGPPTFVQPSNPPAFTGSLELPSLQRGMQPIASRFLSVPGGIHFRKLTLTWSYGEDLLLIMALVRECSHTLESLNITCNVPGASIRYLRPYQ